MANNRKTTHGLITNVYKFCKEEAQFGHLRISLHRVMERVCTMVKSNHATVYRALREESSGSLDEQSRATSHKPRSRRRKLDTFDVKIIRYTMHQLLARGQLVTLDNVIYLLREAGVVIHPSSLDRSLRMVGFKCSSHGGVKSVRERTSMVASRHHYLREMNRYREEGVFNIVYTNETYLDRRRKASKETGQSMHKGNPRAKHNRLIILEAGNEDGFLNNADMAFTSRGGGDYHEDLDHDTYMKWIRSFVQSLPGPTLFVMDDAPYHNALTEESKYPLASTDKCEIQAWLRERGVYFEPDMLKCELLEIVKQHRPPHRRYILDEFLGEHGHVVLRLPHQHSELNPIEYVWAFMKRYVSRKNVKLSMENLKELFAESKEEAIQQNVWASAVERVMETEKLYWETDHILDEVPPVEIERGADRGRYDSDSDESSSETDDASDRDSDVGDDDSQTTCLLCGFEEPVHVDSDDDIFWLQCETCSGWVHALCCSRPVKPSHPYTCRRCDAIFGGGVM